MEAAFERANRNAGKKCVRGVVPEGRLLADNPWWRFTWYYERVQDWSAGSPDGRAYLHVFRKTSLQYARTGEDLNRQVAADARLGVSVMLTSYVKESDEEMRARSNRTYLRIAASLPPEVARRYGHEEVAADPLLQRFQEAFARQDWGLVSRLTADLQHRGEPGRPCEIL